MNAKLSPTLAEQLAGPLKGWVVVKPALIDHPDNPGRWGILVQYQATGQYGLAIGHTIASVPQSWAAGLDTQRDR